MIVGFSDMRLIEVKDIEQLKFYKRTNYNLIVEEFLNSDMMCAEVKDYNCKDSYVCAYNMRRALERMKVSNVNCYSHQGRVFMQRVRFDEHKD